MKYKAFVSHRHETDQPLAARLESGLQRLGKPWHQRRSFRVFRDDSDLNLTPHLWADIQTALAESEFLILLASPGAAESIWVAKEIETWLAKNGTDRLLIVATDGVLEWSEDRADFDWERTSCLPDVLRGHFEQEPLHLDLRWTREIEKSKLSLDVPEFRKAVAQLSATLQGIGLEDVLGEELRQHVRLRRIRNAAIVTLSLLLIAAALLAVVATRQRDAALNAGLLTRVSLDLSSGRKAHAIQLARFAAERSGSSREGLRALHEVASDPGAVLSSTPAGSGPPQFSNDERLFISLDAGLGGGTTMEARDLYGALHARRARVADAQPTSDPDVFLVARHSGGLLGMEVEFPHKTCRGSVWLPYHFWSAGSGDGDDLFLADGSLTGGDRSQLWDPRLGRLFRLYPGCGVVMETPGRPNVASVQFALPDAGSLHLAPDGTTLAISAANSTRWFDVDGSLITDLRGAAPSIAPGSEAIATSDGVRTLVWDRSGARVGEVAGSEPVLGPKTERFYLDSTGRTWAAIRLVTRIGADLGFHDFEMKEVMRIPADSAAFVPGAEHLIVEAGDSASILDVGGHEVHRLRGAHTRFAGRWLVTVGEDGLLRWIDPARLPLRSVTAARDRWGEGPGSDASGQDSSRGSIEFRPFPVSSVGELIPDGSSGELIKVGLLTRDVVDRTKITTTTDLAYSRSADGGVAFGNRGEVTLLSGDLEPIATWRAGDATVRHVSLSRDDQRVLSSGDDGFTQLWQVGAEAPVVRLGPHESGVVFAAFSTDERQVVTLTQRGIARLWHLDGTLVAAYDIPGEPIRTVRFSTAGEALLMSIGAEEPEQRTFRRFVVEPRIFLEETDWVEPLPQADVRALGF